MITHHRLIVVIYKMQRKLCLVIVSRRKFMREMRFVYGGGIVGRVHDNLVYIIRLTNTRIHSLFFKHYLFACIIRIRFFIFFLLWFFYLRRHDLVCRLLRLYLEKSCLSLFFFTFYFVDFLRRS